MPVEEVVSCRTQKQVFPADSIYAKNANVDGRSSFMMQVECEVAILQHTGIRRIKNSQYV